MSSNMPPRLRPYLSIDASPVPGEVVASRIAVEDDCRPATRDQGFHECSYCGTAIGTPHREGCDMHRKVVIVRAVIEYPVTVPADWDTAMVEFHRNDSSWCCDNLVDELGDLVDRCGAFDAPDLACLCPRTRFEYVRPGDEMEVAWATSPLPDEKESS